jgi:hypothetical protein
MAVKVAEPVLSFPQRKVHQLWLDLLHQHGPKNIERSSREVILFIASTLVLCQMAASGVDIA